MANLWNHPSIIAAEALRHLEDALVITPACAMDKTSEFTTRANGWKKGDTVSFKTYGDYETTDFSTTIATQDIRSSTRPMQIEKHFDISVAVTAREEALDLDSFSDEVIRPAVYRMAESVDQYVGTKILDGKGLYVENGLFADAESIALARKYAIVQQLAMNRFCLCDLSLEALLLGQTWFNQAQTRGGPGVSTLQSGIMGRVMGMDFMSSINFPTTSRTPATLVAATDNGSGGNTNNRIGVSTLTIDVGSTGGVTAGDHLYIAGVRRPLRVKTTQADTSAATTIALVDPITEIIPDNTAVSVINNGAAYTVQGAIFDSRSLAVAFPMLDLPGDRVAAVASNNGINVRIVKGYDLTYKKTTLSIDMLCGAFALDPRRITLLAETVGDVAVPAYATTTSA